MIKIVVDTSVIVKWLNQTNENYIKEADEILKLALAKKLEIISPELAKYELGNVILKGKKVPSTQAKILLHTLYLLPIKFITESEELAILTFKIATNLKITYYDASFLALAKTYNATLLTENIKHQGKSRTIKVKSLKEY